MPSLDRLAFMRGCALIADALLLRDDTPNPYGGPINVYDVGQPDEVGAVYPDGSRQLHRRKWWDERLKEAAANAPSRRIRVRLPVRLPSKPISTAFVPEAKRSLIRPAAPEPEKAKRVLIRPRPVKV